MVSREVCIHRIKLSMAEAVGVTRISGAMWHGSNAASFRVVRLPLAGPVPSRSLPTIDRLVGTNVSRLWLAMDREEDLAGSVLLPE